METRKEKTLNRLQKKVLQKKAKPKQSVENEVRDALLGYVFLENSAAKKIFASEKIKEKEEFLKNISENLMTSVFFKKIQVDLFLPSDAKEKKLFLNFYSLRIIDLFLTRHLEFFQAMSKEFQILSSEHQQLIQKKHSKHHAGHPCHDGKETCNSSHSQSEISIKESLLEELLKVKMELASYDLEIISLNQHLAWIHSTKSWIETILAMNPELETKKDSPFNKAVQQISKAECLALLKSAKIKNSEKNSKKSIKSTSNTSHTQIPLDAAEDPWDEILGIEFSSANYFELKSDTYQIKDSGSRNWTSAVKLDGNVISQSDKREEIEIFWEQFLYFQRVLQEIAVETNLSKKREKFTELSKYHQTITALRQDSRETEFSLSNYFIDLIKAVYMEEEKADRENTKKIYEQTNIKELLEQFKNKRENYKRLRTNAKKHLSLSGEKVQIAEKKLTEEKLKISPEKEKTPLQNFSELRQEADTLLLNKKFEEAIKKYNECLTIAEDNTLTMPQLEVLLSLGDLYQVRLKLEPSNSIYRATAIDYYQQVIDKINSFASKTSEIKDLLGFAEHDLALLTLPEKVLNEQEIFINDPKDIAENPLTKDSSTPQPLKTETQYTALSKLQLTMSAAIMPLPKDIVAILTCLKDYYPLVVGGAVRDYLMRKIPRDFDLISTATPEQTLEILSAKGYECKIAGKNNVAHVIVMAYKNETTTTKFVPPIDVNTFQHMSDQALRKEILATLRAKAGFADSENNLTILADAYHRDLVFNTFYYNHFENTIYQTIHKAEVALQNGEICLIREPKEQFEEDPLRILRVIDQWARLAKKPLSKDITKAINQTKTFLSTISPNRLGSQLIKIFSNGYGLKNFNKLQELGLLPSLLPTVNQIICENPKTKEAIKKYLTARDKRYNEGKTNSSVLLFAQLYWHGIISELHHNQSTDPKYLSGAIDIFLKKDFELLGLNDLMLNQVKKLWLAMLALHPQYALKITKEILPREEIYSISNLLLIFNKSVNVQQVQTSIAKNLRSIQPQRKANQPNNAVATASSITGDSMSTAEVFRS